ncbi:hypothetical protein [Actinoalloteichus caeruleus]|uniref:hypothetical protein n=1 Tax=Actinoalloteichus cyanogriseus TaxID=2893586 RepID=UPI003AADE89E
MDEEFHVSVVVSFVADTEEACRFAEEGGVLAEQYLPGRMLAVGAPRVPSGRQGTVRMSSPLVELRARCGERKAPQGDQRS